MVQSINNSNLSQGILRSLNQAQEKEQTALERISSGKQVNNAADNAAGLAIIERFASQIDGVSQAIRNASDGISLAQVAESSLSSVGEDVQRIRELSVQAANGALGDNDRADIQSQVSQLQQQVSRGLDQANFNGVDIFKTDAVIEFQVGADASDTIELTTSDLSNNINALTSIDVSTQAGAQNALAVADTVLETFNNQQVDFGALSNRVQSSISNLQNNRESTASARSRIEDVGVGREVSQNIEGQIQQQSGIAVQSQANTSAKLVLQLLS